MLSVLCHGRETRDQVSALGKANESVGASATRNGTKLCDNGVERHIELGVRAPPPLIPVHTAILFEDLILAKKLPHLGSLWSIVGDCARTLDEMQIRERLEPRKQRTELYAQYSGIGCCPME